MKTYLVHHKPHHPQQDTWAVAFTLPYIAARYARAGEGLWYIDTWLTAEQIKRRLAVLFAERDELIIHDVGRDVATINGQINWLDGRLEDEEPMELPPMSGPRTAWAAFQALVEDLARPLTGSRSGGFTASRTGNLRAA
jgi:hypothetical protein